MVNKIFIKTFGCQMNEYDSNRIFDTVKKIGFSKTSDQSVRDEWSKIQGRFIDIPINVSAEEQINLMSHSLSYDEGVWEKFDQNGPISTTHSKHIVQNSGK